MINGFNPLSLGTGALGALGGGQSGAIGGEQGGSNPLEQLASLLAQLQQGGPQGAAQAGQASPCSCGAGCSQGGASGCGCAACQKASGLGF